MLFEMRQGMVDRGADISWLSQYPHEEEILFAPLTCIELRGSHTEEGVIILDMSLSINLMAPTIEKVIAKLKTSQEDLIRLLTADFKVHRVDAEQALAPLEQQLKAVRARDGAWFNEAQNFESTIADVFVARHKVLQWMLENGLPAPCPQGICRAGLVC